MAWRDLKHLFRKKFLSISTNYSDSGPSPIEPPEPITRFIFSSSHFAPGKGRVKHAALGPDFIAASQRWEASVYRTQDIDSIETWNICSKHVDQPATKRFAKARGTCPARVILETELVLDPNGIPHPRHANILSWPTRKDEQMLMQQKIAAEMLLELRSAI
jgi:hypothetical protein